MSEEEATQYKDLLHDITKVMNCMHLNPAPTVMAPNGAPRFLYMGILNENRPEYSMELLSIYSDEAKLELESATSALNYFCENYVDDKNKQDFQSLIHDFYTHNSKFLDHYESIFAETAPKDACVWCVNAILQSLGTVAVWPVSGTRDFKGKYRIWQIYGSSFSYKRRILSILGKYSSPVYKTFQRGFS